MKTKTWNLTCPTCDRKWPPGYDGTSCAFCGERYPVDLIVDVHAGFASEPYGLRTFSMGVRCDPGVALVEAACVVTVERKCRRCGCTESRPCPGGCFWHEDDLCSACALPLGYVTRTLP